MQRKVIVSGPVRGKLTEGRKDYEPSRARLRTATGGGQRQGSKAPPPEDGFRTK